MNGENSGDSVTNMVTVIVGSTHDLQRRGELACKHLSHKTIAYSKLSSFCY